MAGFLPPPSSLLLAALFADILSRLLSHSHTLFRSTLYLIDAELIEFSLAYFATCCLKDIVYDLFFNPLWDVELSLVSSMKPNFQRKTHTCAFSLFKKSLSIILRHFIFKTCVGDFLLYCFRITEFT